MRFIDLFAGIGGIRIPFEELGFKCMFSSEWDKFACKTYEANFGEKPQGDITCIDEKDIPPHDILLAGFPCQSFSNAGMGRGFDDTRGTMFFEILRILNYRRPRYVLLENVKGLKSHDSGKTLKRMLLELRTLGYRVDWKVLNAKDFGLPQNRQRIYIIGSPNKTHFPNFAQVISKAKVACEVSGHEVSDHFADVGKMVDLGSGGKYQLTSPTRVGDILEKEVDPKYTISHKLYTGHQRRAALNKMMGKGFGYSEFNADSPYVNTITARYGKDGSEALISGDNLPRKLTPREIARLQGFPDSFKLPCSDTQSYKQLGNSVAINVIRAIAKNLIP